MKGADQCPKCGSRKWQDNRQAITDFYAEVIRMCGNCKTAWEPFESSDLLDAHDRYSSFKEPCNNCAFRKGSPEQKDPEQFAKLVEKLGWGKGRFFCHKGCPITPDTENGFDYPDPNKNPSKMRYCRGYLNMLNATKFVVQND